MKLYIYIYIYIYPQTHALSFPGFISAARVNEQRKIDHRIALSKVLSFAKLPVVSEQT